MLLTLTYAKLSDQDLLSEVLASRRSLGISDIKLVMLVNSVLTLSIPIAMASAGKRLLQLLQMEKAGWTS